MSRSALPALRVRRPLRSMLAAACAVLLAAGLSLAGIFPAATPAEAAARVSVSGTPSADGTSTLKLSGSGFQSVKNGFGGIYVLFGVVEGTWQPSKGGKTGKNLRYAYDNESNPEGFQLFVTFPGSSTAYAANGGTLNSDGTWSGTIKIPGAKFTSYDRQRNPIDVDCTREQCGIITIGAHGVTNANNESFTPVNFPAAGGEGGAHGQAAAPAAGKEAEQNPGGEPAGAGPSAAPENSGGNAEPAATAPAAPVVQPLLTSDQVEQLNANGNRIVLILLAGLVVAVSLIALAVGVGSYMAAKSLLLGVSPEALERVRARRAKRAIAAEHKRKRRIASYRARQEARTRKRELHAEATAARSVIDSSAEDVLAVDAGNTAAAAEAPVAGPMRFFDTIAPSTSQAAERQTGGSPLQTSTAGASEAATLVLDRPEGNPDLSPSAEPGSGRTKGTV